MRCSVAILSILSIASTLVSAVSQGENNQAQRGNFHGNNSHGNRGGKSHGGNGNNGYGDPSSGKKMIAYYESWAATRGCNQFQPENMTVEAYTHINFAFATIDPTSYCVKPSSAVDTELYRRTVALKARNPNLQVWISLGGWSFTDPGPTLNTFSEIAADPGKQTTFINSLKAFMKTHGFSGVDIDWEYPAAADRGGKPEDTENLVKLVQEMRKSFGRNYGITITLPASANYLKGFELGKLKADVDWFNVMTYDFHGTWDNPAVVKHHASLNDIKTAMDLMASHTVTPEQLVLGLAFYGRTYTLADPKCRDIDCGFSGPGQAGECSQVKGSLTYAEIMKLKEGGGCNEKVDLDAGIAMFSYNGDTEWVGYDNAQTFQVKLNFARDRGLAGSMIWAASQDTIEGAASHALISSPPVDNNAAGVTGTGDTENQSGGTDNTTDGTTGTVGDQNGAQKTDNQGGVQPLPVPVADANATGTGGNGTGNQDATTNPIPSTSRKFRRSHRRFHRTRRSSHLH